MRVAITGGSGSLGRCLIEKLAKEGADRIVTMSRDEQKRLALQDEYAAHPHVKVYAGDIRDEQRLRDVFRGCEVVIHAAARKVVCGHYDEPPEHHKTNVIGTINVLAAARATPSVNKLLFISSDKACAPINVYGISKAMAEALVLSENARCFASGLRCSVVRYGNVLGSNGSVVQKWRAAIEAGKPLEVSDQKMTRFWWTIGDAAEAALRAVADMRGGEVLVPHLSAAPLVTVMKAMAGEDVPDGAIKEIGIRPGGEKLHEILLDEEELRRALKRGSWIIVPPLDNSDLWDRSPWLGEPVAEDFTYCSETWPDQWTAKGLREVLNA